MSFKDYIKLAKIELNSKIDVYAVHSFSEEKWEGLNLSDLLPNGSTDPMDIFTSNTYQEVKNFINNSETIEFSPTKILAPVEQKFALCAGLNYKDHKEEAAISDSVLLFPKYCTPTPTNSEVDSSRANLLDYEIELGMICSQDIKSEKDYEKSIFGYFIANDVTARDLQILKSEKNNAKGFCDSKSFPGYLPVGPILCVPNPDLKEEFEQSLDLELKVNGQTRQKSHSSLMILAPKEIIKIFLTSNKTDPDWHRNSHISTNFKKNTLPAKSLILTGTPGGTAFMAPRPLKKLGFILQTMFHFPKNVDLITMVKQKLIKEEMENKNYLQARDEVVCKISHLGTLKFRVK